MTCQPGSLSKVCKDRGVVLQAVHTVSLPQSICSHCGKQEVGPLSKDCVSAHGIVLTSCVSLSGEVRRCSVGKFFSGPLGEWTGSAGAVPPLGWRGQGTVSAG